MLADEFDVLRKRISEKSPLSEATMTPISHGGALIKVTSVDLGGGWNRPKADVIFVVPAGYPNAPPDCFWVEPAGLRLTDGRPPQSSNDSNPIPGDTQTGRTTTWFSWHVQGWNPNKTNGLFGFYQLILDRLRPAR